ncbi:helix-turn-helix transcriptional regulator [Hymenobacter sp. BT559]|nr:AraC family transcriptional regulator [Hymenobacter sp. BT559]MBJ6145359.1 helix-turn-helix transcriptional regulator [Hymenobacter sp. BT559]
MTVGLGAETTDLDGTFLLCINPLVPHSVVHHSAANNGYACVFTEAFVANLKRTERLQYSPLFHVGDSPIIQLTSEQTEFMAGLFRQMLAVQQDEYNFKEEVVKNCLALVLHEALRIQPPAEATEPPSAAVQLTQRFLGLLERQFPLESLEQQLALRTVQDFANRLAVHVNYLNRCVKEATGRPTSAHLAERLVAEAQALLRHTRWSVADIATCLGFAYPTYFNNYFKRETGQTPATYRKQQV